MEVAGDAVVIKIEASELALLANALNEAREAIDDWEFASRMGVSVVEAEKLRQQLIAALDSLK